MITEFLQKIFHFRQEDIYIKPKREWFKEGEQMMDNTEKEERLEAMKKLLKKN
jgi:hypothetical protein